MHPYSVPQRRFGQQPSRQPSRASVIVVADVDGPALRRTLATLARQTKEQRAELILIFSAWPDDLPEPSRRALGPLVDLLLFEPRQGRAVALNTAVHAAVTEVIAFVGVHADLSDRWLQALLEPLDRDENLAGVGGPVETVFKGGEVPRWYRPIQRDSVASFLLPVHHMGHAPCEYPAPQQDRWDLLPLGSNCAWRRKWLLEFPFDESLQEESRPSGGRIPAETGDGEDVLLAHRILAAGARVAYAPRAIAFRPAAKSEVSTRSALEWTAVRGQKYARVMAALGVASPALPPLATGTLWSRRLGLLGRRETAAHLRSFASGSIEAPGDVPPEGPTTFQLAGAAGGETTLERR